MSFRVWRRSSCESRLRAILAQLSVDFYGDEAEWLEPTFDENHSLGPPIWAIALALMAIRLLY